MSKSNFAIIAFFCLVIAGVVGVLNINYLHKQFEADVEECVADGGGYECFF